MRRHSQMWEGLMRCGYSSYCSRQCRIRFIRDNNTIQNFNSSERSFLDPGLLGTIANAIIVSFQYLRTGSVLAKEKYRIVFRRSFFVLWKLHLKKSNAPLSIRESSCFLPLTFLYSRHPLTRKIQITYPKHLRDLSCLTEIHLLEVRLRRGERV